MRLAEIALETSMSEKLIQRIKEELAEERAYYKAFATKMMRFSDRLERLEHLEDALIEAMSFIERYVDVVDGPNGPEPNEAMSLNIHLRQTLDGKYE